MSTSPPDPFDIEALEKAVNDSAVRVSTIWVSFLLFGLYLSIAVGGVTHLQLFLGEALKGGGVNLPIVNTDLRVADFSVVAPVLFVIFHVYLLVQLVLLGRTTEAYNEAVERNITSTSDRARVRQRLANTLFAQMLAGSPRERTGLLGKLLRLMAVMTLAIGPVLLLLAFQIKFLPYQSGLVTVTHRLLIFVDLVAVLILWRGVIEPQRDIGWHLLREGRAAAFGAIAVILFSWLGVHFPGEPFARVRMLLGDRGVCNNFLFTDRLSPSLLDVADDEKLAKIEAAAKVEGRSAQGERTTYDFRNRNLRCGQFRRADFRRADFTWADLRGADLSYANLQGALLRGANLRGADLGRAQLQGADLSWVRGREPWVAARQTFSSWFSSAADLRGVNLTRAQLQGARLGGTWLDDAQISAAQMQGADLYLAILEGSRLQGAQMQGASLYQARLEGADLTRAQLRGANLVQVHLEGALLDEASLKLAEIRHSYLWRASGAKCDEAQVAEPQLDLILQRKTTFPLASWDLLRGPVTEYTGEPVEEYKATPNEEANFVDRVASGRPEKAQHELRRRFIANPEQDETAKNVWLACESKALSRSDYERQHTAYLVELVCQPDDPHTSYAIFAKWFEEPDELLDFTAIEEDEVSSRARRLQAIARGFVGEWCPGAKVLSEQAIKRLQSLNRKQGEN
jgi:uncharacterized protein YjbI with pentapeptide repeats